VAPAALSLTTVLIGTTATQMQRRDAIWTLKGMGRNMILLTGATGRVGSAAAKALARANIPFRALVRDPDKVAFDPDAAEIVQGDLNDPAIVEQALQGVSRALIVMGNHPDQAKLERQFASLAADGGVSHLVKVSSMEAAPDATATLPKNHYDTEQHIASLGVDWTFLRPNYYMQNMLMYAGSIARTNSFALPLGTAKTAMIDSRDVGEVAAVVLTGEGHAGQAYRLTGPAIMDFHEVAARMGTVLERPVSYLAQSPEAFREVLGQFIQSVWQLDAVCELFAEIAAGSLEEQHSTTADLLGRPAVDLETFTRQFAEAFAPAG
jgi:uncharacterized protein YbjT (DUF2867 family)